jgi:hypothetical protein
LLFFFISAFFIGNCCKNSAITAGKEKQILCILPFKKLRVPLYTSRLSLYSDVIDKKDVYNWREHRDYCT